MVDDLNDDKDESSTKTAANNRAGFWIMVVIIAGALYVAVSPFIGATFQYREPVVTPAP